MNHSIGTPVRNIAMLPTVKSAPAMPPPKTIFDALIWGRGASLMVHPLSPSYHSLRFQRLPHLPTLRYSSSMDVLKMLADLRQEREQIEEAIVASEPPPPCTTGSIWSRGCWGRCGTPEPAESVFSLNSGSSRRSTPRTGGGSLHPAGRDGLSTHGAMADLDHGLHGDYAYLKMIYFWRYSSTPQEIT